MLFADPGSGGGATGALLVGPLPDGELLPGVAELACIDCRTLSGLTITGLETDERVCAATFITMSCWRSCSSRVMESLCGSALRKGVSPAAPLLLGLIMYAATVTTATRNAATPIAGKMMPVRRSSPFFFRALRGFVSGPVLRDAPLKDGPFRGADAGREPEPDAGSEAGSVASSVAVRCR